VSAATSGFAACKGDTCKAAGQSRHQAAQQQPKKTLQLCKLIQTC
jgi:hypothetical protein